MKSFLSIILLLFIFHGNAQQLLGYTQKLKRIDNLLQQNKYEFADKELKALIFDAKKIYGEKSKQLSKLYFVLGFTNIRLKKINLAIEYLEKSISITESINADREEHYISSLFVLGQLYALKGNNKETELIIDRAVNKIDNIFEKSSTMYYSHLNRAAGFYSSLNLYYKAEPLGIKIRDFTKKKFGEGIDYIVASKNLAMMYIESERKQEGVTILREIIPLAKKLEKKTEFSVKSISFYKALAEIYFYSENNVSAISIYEKLLRFYEESNTHFDYDSFAGVLNNLGQVYDKIGDYDNAIKYSERSLREIEKSSGVKSQQYLTTLSNLSYIFWSANDIAKSLEYFNKTILGINASLTEKKSFMSENEKEIFYLKYIKDYDGFNSFSLENTKNEILITSKVYDNTLFLKNQLLNSSISLRNKILSSNNKELTFNFNEWISIKKRIVLMYESGNRNDKDELTSLIQKANSLERFLVSKSNIFKDFNDKNSLRWFDIQKNLKPNEVAIEFIDFLYYNKGWTDERYYCALIINKECISPEMIFLFKESQLNDVLNKNSNNKKNGIESIYGTKGKSNRELYDLIWKPIEKYTIGKNKVFFSPSGLLNYVSFSAISDGKQFLANSLNLFRLTSTSKIKDINYSIDGLSRASLFGGIDYGPNSGRWHYLNGTKDEVNEISKVLNSKNVHTKIYSGINATEEELKSNINSQILHIATHGFFDKQIKTKPSIEYGEVSFDRGQANYTSNVKNPLLRSGLVFAGANNNDSAILTALEVANLNMSELDLVVLSACETGLGDIKGNEGVYGLQRSFKMAGVEYLIVSLWKVPDKETKDFMVTFYENLFKIGNIESAFNTTQKAMSEKYDPYYWGAFILNR